MAEPNGKGGDGRADATRLIHPRGKDGTISRTVGPPIQRGSTVLMPRAADLYDHSQITYGRQGLAAQGALQEALAELEGGAGCELYPSGLAALTAAMLAVLKAGDEILVVDTIYAPTRRFCDRMLARFGVKVGYYPPRLPAEELLALGGPNLRLIVLESPGSLTLEMQDAPAIARAAKARGVLTLMDNTWGAGLLFKPLAHGIDLSVQALTKYVCGTSDVFMGSVCASDPKLIKALADGVMHMGWAVAPDEAYQALRGLRTLPVRMARHDESALTIARWLAEQAEVIAVIHPALPTSPDHALWARDYAGSCGLFSFLLRPAPEVAVHAFLDQLTLFGLGFSWGGFESLAVSSGDQLHQRRHAPKLAGPLIRLHIGLEATEDLIGDLRRGLDAFAETRTHRTL
ncbi:MAG TPA: cystathionine beta-lyase [Caulobacteraceae bacterium]